MGLYIFFGGLVVICVCVCVLANAVLFYFICCSATSEMAEEAWYHTFKSWFCIDLATKIATEHPSDIHDSRWSHLPRLAVRLLPFDEFSFSIHSDSDWRVYRSTCHRATGGKGPLGGSGKKDF